MKETRREEWAGVLALTALALTLSLWGGTPFQQLDSIVLRARHVLETGGNPEFFHYPALVIYLATIPYGILHAILGDEAAQELMRASSREFETPFFSYFFPGHLLSASFGVLGVLSVRSILKSLFGNTRVALCGGALLATSLLWITDTHLVTVDVPLAALLALTAERAVRFMSHDRALSLRETLVLGVCAGLATAAKYNGALILAPLTAALWLHARRHGGSQLLAFFVPGLAAFATFLITNPFVLIEFDAFWTDLMFEWKHSKMGHAGYLAESGFDFHLSNSLMPGFGFAGLFLSCAGVVALIRTRGVSVPLRVLLLGFPAAHFLLIGSSKLAFQRYMLPMLPFLAVLAAATLAVQRRPGEEGGRVTRWLAIGIAVFALGRGAYWGARHNQLLAKPDIRRELVLALSEARLDLGEVPVFAQGDAARCARWAGLPFRRNNAIQSAQLDQNPTRLYLFDSFLQDRVLYDDPPPELRAYYAGDENVRDYTGFEDFTVLQFSPFELDKGDVPVSRKSYYSPSLPDLRVRRRAGPFLELCFVSEEDADRVQEACAELGILCERKPGPEAWYFNQLAELARKRARDE